MSIVFNGSAESIHSIGSDDTVDRSACILSRCQSCMGVRYQHKHCHLGPSQKYKLMLIYVGLHHWCKRKEDDVAVAEWPCLSTPSPCMAATSLREWFLALLNHLSRCIYHPQEMKITQATKGLSGMSIFFFETRSQQKAIGPAHLRSIELSADTLHVIDRITHVPLSLYVGSIKAAERTHTLPCGHSA
jgi:hypothetical protein